METYENSLAGYFERRIFEELDDRLWRAAMYVDMTKMPETLKINLYSLYDKKMQERFGKFNAHRVLSELENNNFEFSKNFLSRYCGRLYGVDYKINYRVSSCESFLEKIKIGKTACLEIKLMYPRGCDTINFR